VSRVPFSISRLVQAGHRSSDVSFLLNEGDLARTAAGGSSRKLLREFCKHFAPFCWLLDFQRACGSCSTAAPLTTDSLPTSRSSRGVYRLERTICMLAGKFYVVSKLHCSNKPPMQPIVLCRGHHGIPQDAVAVYAQFTALLLFDAGEARKGESRLHRKTLSPRRHRSP
jgi:hypothetical protein